MKKIEFWLIVAIILIFSWSIHFYYNNYARPDLPENIEPLESVFSIEPSVAKPMLTESPTELPAEAGMAEKTAAVSVQTHPASADLTIARKLAADLLLWPLSKNPDFWLVRAYLIKCRYKEAGRILAESLGKPQPWHLRFVFNWLKVRLKFIEWLEQKPERMESQVRESLIRLVGAFPSIFAKRTFVPGVGYLASDTAILNSIISPADLVASATEQLLATVNAPKHFARHFLQDRVRSQRYCQKRCCSANMLLAPPEISERYAEVDYVYQARLLQMSNLGIARMAEPDAVKADLERNWMLPNLPVCNGNIFAFSRHKWSCPLHEPLDIKLENDAGDALDEAWVAFLLCNPQYISVNFE